MNTQKHLTTIVKNTKRETVSARQCTEPSQKVKQVYDLMGYKTVPFHRKKYVVSLQHF
jgi:hypothetical protein